MAHNQSTRRGSVASQHRAALPFGIGPSRGKLLQTPHAELHALYAGSGKANVDEEAIAMTEEPLPALTCQVQNVANIRLRGEDHLSPPARSMSEG